MRDNLEKEGGNNDEIFPKEYVDYLNQLLLYEARLEACADRKRPLLPCVSFSMTCQDVILELSPMDRHSFRSTNGGIFSKEYVDYLNQLLLYEARLEACADRKRRKQRKGKGKNQKKEKVKRKRKQSCEPYRN